jgi:hypothetical protein
MGAGVPNITHELDGLVILLMLFSSLVLNVILKVLETNPLVQRKEYYCDFDVACSTFAPRVCVVELAGTT